MPWPIPHDQLAAWLRATYATFQAQASAVAPLDTEHADAYRQGFEDALRSVAVAFDVSLIPAERRARISE